jgi:hypothetical protein
MGATTFTTKAHGKTVAEAFHSAVEDAYYWNGHGGYSGTIAEKPSATVFTVPLHKLPELPEDAPAFVKDMGERVANATYWYMEKMWNKTTDPWTVEETHDWAKVAQADAKVLYDNMGKQFVAMTELADDKWENACAFSLGNDEWFFFGYASC